MIISRCVIPINGLMMCLLISGCAMGSAQRLPYLVRENLDNAKRHLEQNNLEEAAQIYQAVLLADPKNAEAMSGLKYIGSYETGIIQPNLLGKNLCRHPKRKSNRLRLTLYPVNRILDLLDVVSFHAGLEGGVLADVHATHAVQAQAGASGGVQVGWWQGRNLAVGSGNVAGFALGPFNCEVERCMRVGTRGAETQSYFLVTMGRPTDLVYQRYRDYWGIGGRVTAFIAGAGLELHPVELVDALCGFLFIDFLNDDLGHTRKLKLNSADIAAMEDLLNTLSPDVLRNNLSYRHMPVSNAAIGLH